MKKVVLITGASRGIGRACALLLAKDFDVVINYNKNEEKAMELYHKLTDMGCNSLLVRADVSKRQDVARMMDEIISRYGRIDVLVNNAGIARQELFSDVTNDQWQNMMDVNIGGVFNCTQEALKYMIRAKSGKIINISSVWGITGASCEVAYSTSKAAIIGFTKALAKELAPSHITVNAVAPGVISTDMCDFDEETIDELKDEIPLMRIGEAMDVAHVVEFLSKEASDYITGEVINISGGFVV